MSLIQLIANSGIQIYKFDIEIRPNADVIRSMGFHESINYNTGDAELGFARYLEEEEIWVREQQLREDGCLDEHGNLLEDIDTTLLTELDEDEQVYTISDVKSPLELFENHWLPVPFFEKKNANNIQFGPTNWCRLKLLPVRKQRRGLEYKVILIFDTKEATAPDDNESPTIKKVYGRSKFGLCGDVNLIKNFYNNDIPYFCGWVEEYLLEVVHRGKQNRPKEFPRLKYLAHYTYLIKYLSKLKILPDVELYPSTSDSMIDVDLVLDIGNSNTCGVLFENTGEAFKFDKVKKLKIQDLSNPIKEYDEPFSMRLAFHKCDFGEMRTKTSKFNWPSFIRIGKEAKRLIYNSTNKVSTDGRELATNHSSPKRYLWDNAPSNMRWELIKSDKVVAESSQRKAIYLKGITEQFKSDGSYKITGKFGQSDRFSRKSLMTFVMIEILAHAMVQINSYDFRRKHGNSNLPRRLRRLVLTCPTAMVQAEQIALRQCAQEASVTLNRFFNNTYNNDFDVAEFTKGIEVVPSVKDLRKNLTLLDTRKDWIYDEATCCQLVFLYAEISKRYLNKCDSYFNLHGKYRNDLEDYNKKAITIGSIDIGAGTTDLMICAYEDHSEDTTSLKPHPLYWESFNLAGDDLLKAVVKQVVIEGKAEDGEEGYTGVIENYARRQRVRHIERKLNMFFGTDSANIDFVGRQMRRRFNVQVAVPIAELYLAHAQENLPNKYVTFNEIFGEHQPSQDILEYFRKHFGFKFEDISWELSTNRINKIIETIFEPLIKQICILLHIKGCDFVLLAGRPTSLQKISDLFLKFYPVSPNKIISLKEYRVGRWYPFQDGNGYFTDHKSIVAVGASIALMGGRLGLLNGFNLDMDLVKRKLISTAEYLGVYDRNIKKLNNTFISPDENNETITVAGLPLTIGFKQLDAKAYPARIIYYLDFDDKKILERRKKKLGDIPEEEQQDVVDAYKTSIRNRMPLRVKIDRAYRENREELKVNSIFDKTGETIPRSIFTMKLKTLDEENGYWLDTGEFHLNIEPQ